MKVACPNCGSCYDVEEVGEYECPNCNNTFAVRPPQKRIIVKPTSSSTASLPASAHKSNKLGLTLLLVFLLVGIIGGIIAFFHIQRINEEKCLKIVKQATIVHSVTTDALHDFNQLGYRPKYDFLKDYDTIQHKLTQRLGLPELYQNEVRPLVAQVCEILPQYREELSSSTGEAWACFSVRSYGGSYGGTVGATVDVSSYSQKGVQISEEIIKPMRAEIVKRFTTILDNCKNLIRSHSKK